ncbi:MAG: sigma-70 family RNA polymerase sigma factor [Planctomycetota bacterium]
MTGDLESVEEQPNIVAYLESHRPALTTLARSRMSGKLLRKMDAEDLVQETLRRALACWQSHRDPGTSLPGEPWLTTILDSAIKDAVRHHRAQRRSVEQEESIFDTPETSAQQIAERIALELSTPSLIVTRQEQINRLAASLDSLGATTRAVIVAKYLRGRTLAEMESELGLTKPSIAGHLRRGLAKLRLEMQSSLEIRQ